MRRRLPGTLPAVVFLLAITTAACGGDGDASTTTTVAPPTTETTDEASPVSETDTSVVITVTRLSFPVEVMVPAGKSVVWVNESSAPHEVQMDTFDGADVDVEPVRLRTDQQGELTLDPGTWTYFCTIHASMTGSLVVEG